MATITSVASAHGALTKLTDLQAPLVRARSHMKLAAGIDQPYPAGSTVSPLDSMAGAALQVRLGQRRLQRGAREYARAFAHDATTDARLASLTAHSEKLDAIVGMLGSRVNFRSPLDARTTERYIDEIQTTLRTARSATNDLRTARSSTFAGSLPPDPTIQPIGVRPDHMVPLRF